MPADDPPTGFGPPSTNRLDPERIVYTIGKLNKRIEERLPGSGLGRLCASLYDIGEHTRERLDHAARGIVWLRVLTWSLALIMVVGFAPFAWAAAVALSQGLDQTSTALADLQAGIQDAVYIGLAVAFLVTAEDRLQRRRALRDIRELRAIAHIVDMHQLTKDPDKLLRPGPDTESSPTRTLTLQELGRYLDYCSELLSLTSKLAALYAERFDDSVVLQAVDEVEALTTGLSRKIWQKIMILDSVALRDA